MEQSPALGSSAMPSYFHFVLHHEIWKNFWQMYQYQHCIGWCWLRQWLQIFYRNEIQTWPSQLRSLDHFLNRQWVHHWRFEDIGSHPNCLCRDHDRIRICNFWYRWFEQELKTFGRLDDCLWLVPRLPNHRFDNHYPDLKIFNLTNFVIFAIIAISSTFDEFCNFLWFREIVDLVIFHEFGIVFIFVNFCDFLWFYEFCDFLEFDDLPSGIGMKLATCNAGKTCEFIGLFKRSKAKSE